MKLWIKPRICYSFSEEAVKGLQKSVNVTHSSSASSHYPKSNPEVATTRVSILLTKGPQHRTRSVGSLSSKVIQSGVLLGERLMDLNPWGPSSQIECYENELAFAGHDETEKDESGEQPPHGEEEGEKSLRE